MKSRFEQFQKPGQRRRFALFRSCAAAALVAVLFAGAIFVPDGVMPGAQFGVDYELMQPRSGRALAAPLAGHVFESSRASDLYVQEFRG
jgi:hypothetical protein